METNDTRLDVMMGFDTQRAIPARILILTGLSKPNRSRIKLSDDQKSVWDSSQRGSCADSTDKLAPVSIYNKLHTVSEKP